MQGLCLDCRNPNLCPISLSNAFKLLVCWYLLKISLHLLQQPDNWAPEEVIAELKSQLQPARNGRLFIVAFLMLLILLYTTGFLGGFKLGRWMKNAFVV